MNGYPSVTAVDQAGEPVDMKVDDATDSPVWRDESAGVVDLQPGGSAGVYVGTLANPDHSCTPELGGAVRVSPPGGGATAAPVSVSLLVCGGGTLYVSPVVSTTSLPS